VLLAGVASGTVLLTALPAALAFAATGSPNPNTWRWEEVTGRLSACTSRGGLGSLVNCRPVEAVGLQDFVPEEHRKGRRVIVFVPVPAPELAAAPTARPSSHPSRHLSPTRSSPQPKHAVSSPTARPVHSASPSISPTPHRDEDGGGRD
jgi:hypothetical protein